MPAGSLGLGFSPKPQIRISLSDNSSYGRGWEVRIHEEETRNMCILTEKDGQLTADYRHLVPKAGGYDFQPLADPAFAKRAQALLVETVAYLERKKAEEIEANRRASDKLTRLAGDEAVMARWRALVQVLAPNPASAEKIAKATGRAFSAPQTFIRRLHLSRVTEDVPWLALIDALRKEKLLVEFDWKEDADELAAGVDRLCAQSGHPSLDWATLSPEKATSAADLLNAANRALEVNGVMLVCLDTASDSFPTALLAAASFEVASSHAAAFGCKLKRHFA